jgi:hypothetical protein
MNSVWVLFHPKPVSTLPVGAKPKLANCEERKIHQVEKKTQKNSHPKFSFESKQKLPVFY